MNKTEEFLRYCTHSQLRLLLLELIDIKQKIGYTLVERAAAPLPDMSPLMVQTLDTVPSNDEFGPYSIYDRLGTVEETIRQQMVIRFVCFKFMGESELHTTDISINDRERFWDNSGC